MYIIKLKNKKICKKIRENDIENAIIKAFPIIRKYERQKKIEKSFNFEIAEITDEKGKKVATAYQDKHGTLIRKEQLLPEQQQKETASYSAAEKDQGQKALVKKEETLKIRVPAGTRERIRKRAYTLNMSINAYINMLIENDIPI